jgi:outer membrane immunogenic protein
MSKIKFFAAASAAGLLAGAGTAMAQDTFGADRPYTDEATGFYLGGGYTWLDLETDSDIPELDDQGGSTNAITVRGGYQINPVFSIEVDGTFGVDARGFDLQGDEIDTDALRDIGGYPDEINQENIDSVLAQEGDVGLDYLIGVYGRVGLPINERFHVSGRAGYAFAEVDNNQSFEVVEEEIVDGTTVRTTTRVDRSLGGSDDGFAFGVSGRYSFDDSNAVRLDYTRYNFGEANADAITVTYQYTFGGPGFGF